MPISSQVTKAPRISDNQDLHLDYTLSVCGILGQTYGVATVDDTTLRVTVVNGDTRVVYLLDIITDTA